MRLRYAGTCRVCGAALAAGVTAVYDRATKTVACVTCASAGQPAGSETVVVTNLETPEPPAEVAIGAAGSSAQREYERRKSKRETRIREAHPRMGGLILALSDEPQSTAAWARGARGEELLGGRLNTLVEHGVLTLHDRRIPRTKANIDHIAIGPSGVFVIDAKRYKGRPTLRVEGGILRPRTSKLTVGSRDCTKLVDGVHKQVGLVRAALDNAGFDDTPVHGLLCFVEADWPLFGGSFVIEGVDVLWPKKAAERLVSPGPIDGARVGAIHGALAAAFPVA
ncbi:nuclease-related domain-containing protein [uncultured Cellulomonas sp.]|uniref:nuclease-related domain-containing protein n=1 Tax=uncultured Cellulomonas sp. TaxID=189682 RepID=UPI0028EC6D7B|nr:nuclease-related domain-containing protein [uncultured Cellulomonas sp.]